MILGVIGVAVDGAPLAEIPPAVKESPRNFLLSVPRGAYTAARTTKGRSAVFALDYNLMRIQRSRRLLLASDPAKVDQETAQTSDEKLQQQAVIRTMSAALRSLNDDIDAQKERSEEYSREAMLVVVVTLDDPWQVHAMATLLAGPRSSGAVVEVRYGPRRRAAAKDSLWASQRRALEAARGPGVEETILADEHGNLLEGCTTNLYVLNDRGEVYTAPDAVLEGQLKVALIDKVLPQLSIPVKLEAPTVHSRAEWRGAFITNAYRGLDWVSAVKFPELPSAPDVQLEHLPAIRDIHAVLFDVIDDDSTVLQSPQSPYPSDPTTA